jgi:tetratricopeptide (TPR) repeat protein
MRRDGNEPGRIPLALGFLGTACFALLAYLPTLCPTAYTGDSGELALAASTLGIAHPPGYPLWTLLGRLATLASVRDPAPALNLFSAVCAAGAAGLVSVLLGMLTGRVAVSAGVALAFAMSREVWAQSVISEVYALNLFMTAAALVAAVAGRRGRPGLLLLAVYLLGLGTANHPFVLLAALPVAGLALLSKRLAGVGFPPAIRLPLPMLGLFLLGLTTYLSLPVRWSAGPEISWGGFRSLADFLDHVFRVQYGGVGQGEVDATWIDRLRIFFDILGESVPGPLLGIGAIGLFGLHRSGHAGRAAWLALFFVLSGPATAVAIRYSDTFRDRSVAEPYFLTAVMASFLLCGTGVGFLDRLASRWFGGRRALALISTAAFTLLPPALLWARNHSVCDRSGSTVGAVYAETVLRSLPPEARLYAIGDNETFLLGYFHRAQGLRPDVTLADCTLNLFLEAYGADFAKRSRPDQGRTRLARELDIAFADPDVPIFYTEPIGLGGIRGCRFVRRGLVAQFLRPGEPPLPIDPEPLLVPDTDPDDYHETLLAATMWLRAGEYRHEQGQRSEALACYDEASARAHRIASMLRLLGVAYLELGERDSALARFAEALALDPGDVMTRYHLAIHHSRAGRLTESLAAFDSLLVAEPDHPKFHAVRGIVLAKSERWAEAVREAKTALRLDPGTEIARVLLDALRPGPETGGEAGRAEVQRRLEALERRAAFGPPALRADAGLPPDDSSADGT